MPRDTLLRDRGGRPSGTNTSSKPKLENLRLLESDASAISCLLRCHLPHLRGPASGASGQSDDSQLLDTDTLPRKALSLNRRTEIASVNLPGFGDWVKSHKTLSWMTEQQQQMMMREMGFLLHRAQLDISSTLCCWDLANDVSWHSRAASLGSEEAAAGSAPLAVLRRGGPGAERSRCATKNEQQLVGMLLGKLSVREEEMLYSVASCHVENFLSPEIFKKGGIVCPGVQERVPEERRA
ncbi:Vacuolar Protein Sorting-Associated Protein 13B [Manis pentadactyla]|nr:Vacuolar Protein Sorting-Associated Protein 13B [Manis pentadactyla]